MAYSAPSTISTGDLITASIWNQDVVANPIAIYAGAMSVTSQAVGDILYASSTTQFARIAAVATGQVLTSAGTGTVPAYSATPALTSVDMGGTTVYGSRAITVDTGGVLNIVLASSAGDDFTVDTDKLVVSGDTGYIGVGTAAPTKILHVIGDIKLQSSQVHLTDGYGLLWGDNGINGNASTDSLRLDTAGGARLTIDSAGLVNMGNNLTVNGDAAIGMATIGDGTLHVHTATAGSVTAGGGADDLIVENSTHAGMTFLSPSGDYQQTIAFGDVGDADSGRIVYDHNGNQLAFWTEGAERMRIDSGGKVGIGTTAPAALLNLKSTAPSIYLTSTGTQQANSGLIRFSEHATGVNDYFDLTHNGSDNAFYITSSEVATPAISILRTGAFVGIGTPSPAGLLDAARDTDIACYFGKGFISSTATNMTADRAHFGHVDCENGTDYALVQTAAGATTINCKTGTAVWFGINAGAIGNWTATGLRVGDATGASYKLDVNGSLNKTSGTFSIDHPLPSMKDTHKLVHSFIEGPKADLIYRGTVTLVDGTATVDLDTAAGMSSGTWVLLCRDEQCHTTNETGWHHVRGSISGSTLTIDCEENDCSDTISWLVVASRNDQHMYDTEWTDEDGRPIVEPLKPPSSASASPSE